MLPDLLVVDDACLASVHETWKRRLLACTEQSTGCTSEELLAADGGALLLAARHIVGDLELIHAPHFAIVAGHETEMHRDVGEYAVCYYPLDCPRGPLRTERGDIEVRANRLVAFDATVISHMQVVPDDGSTRYSVALKFRRSR